MEININDSRYIHAIQEEFSSAFPFLKLEFFSRPHKSGGASLKKFLTSNGRTLGECRTKHTKGELIIEPDMTVTELEQGFEKKYGLSVQVFRKSGKVWLETTVTDHWTLEEQNKQGEELSKSAPPQDTSMDME